MARTILIVDDNAIDRKALVAGLQNDYDIIEAANGEEAIAQIRRSHTVLSAVLLDLMMPVKGGFEVLRIVRDDPLLSQLPVIVVTVSDEATDRLEAINYGAIDFVQKPYNLDIVRYCLKNSIALRESELYDRAHIAKRSAMHGDDTDKEETDAKVALLPESGAKAKSAPQKFTPRAFLVITLMLLAVMVGLLLFASPGRPGSHMDSFSETILTLSDGWTLTDSSGASRAVQFPLTINYGADGLYTLTGALPVSNAIIQSPALCIYSNYVDMDVEIGGEKFLVYPDKSDAPIGATGNTYHYIRLPAGFEGKSVKITLRCQLGDAITYLLKAPTIGAKATALRICVTESLPSMLLAGCLTVLALMLAALYIIPKRKLKRNNATAYTAIFAQLFACYVFTETSFAQQLTDNPYMLFSVTLMLLALMPVSLIGLFAEEISERFMRIPICLMTLCAINFVSQVVLHYTNVLNFRVMLTCTHITILVSIAVMAVFLLISGSTDKPDAKKRLGAALPMIAGGTADIVLLALNRPSFNNSLWFTLGVTAFILIQFCEYIRGFFVLYRSSLEAAVLRNLAYRDMLTDIGNRNAYECKLMEYSQHEIPEKLCCMVIDINDLKRINDTYGHSIGDAAIVATSKLLSELLPKSACIYRTGGDEFVVLMDGLDEAQCSKLADALSREATKRGDKHSIPLSLAIGYGSFSAQDGNILDFIRRVDSRMYDAKRKQKSAAEYAFKVE